MSSASSTLPVSGHAVATAAGLVPVGAVVATCAHGTRSWDMPSFVSTRTQPVAILELPKLVAAYESARRSLLARLVDRAEELGAHAVVEVRLREVHHEEARVLELTAMRVPWRRRDAPVATTLTARELAQLAAAGWRPAGVVATSGAVYVRGSWEGAQLRGAIQRGTPNAEFADFTAGVARARRVAMVRAQRRARGLRAHGVVGLVLEARREALTARQDLAVTAHALGTAIVAAPPTGFAPPVTRPVLRLDEETA